MSGTSEICRATSYIRFRKSKKECNVFISMSAYSAYPVNITQNKRIDINMTSAPRLNNVTIFDNTIYPRQIRINIISRIKKIHANEISAAIGTASSSIVLLAAGLLFFFI